MIRDDDTELAVLGCMITTNSIIPNIESSISDTDFASELNAKIYRKILEVYSENMSVDIRMLTIANGNKDYVFISELSDKVATGHNWEFYCNKLKRTSIARQFDIFVRTECNDINSINAEDKLQKAVETLSRMADTTGGKKVRKISGIINPILEIIENNVKRKSMLSGYDTGFESLNNILGGLQREMIIIGARPSIGKSAISMQIAKTIAEKKIPVGYFSLEMSGESLGIRMLSTLTNIPTGAIKEGIINTPQFKRVNDGLSKMYDFPLYIVDKIKGTLNEVKSICRQLVRVYGVQAIFIDHVSLIKSMNRNIPRFEQFAEISNELQALQRELGISLVIVMQLGRNTEGKLPELSDLRESGSFEQDADCVMLLHRDRQTEKNQTDQYIPASLFVAKNRNGACGVAKLTFEPRFVRFIDEKTVLKEKEEL